MNNRTCSEDDCDRPPKTKGMCGKHYNRAWYHANPERARARALEWHHAHPEQAKRRAARHYAENADEQNALKRAAYQADRESFLAKSAEWHRQNPDAWRRYRDADPERWALADRSRQGRQRARRAGTPALSVDYSAVLAEHGMTCHICTEAITSLDDLHFDHVIPIVRGGSHTADNVRPSHVACNRRKASSLPT